MSTQEHELTRFLKLLDEAGALDHVVLIGSWAEYLYERADALEEFESNTRTLDMDFPVRNLRRPKRGSTKVENVCANCRKADSRAQKRQLPILFKLCGVLLQGPFYKYKEFYRV